MSRNVMLAGVIGLVVVAAGVGWLVGSQIRSPAELAAEAEPPPASNITVEVVREELSSDVITRGDVVYDEPVQVTLSGSFAEQPARLIVTHTVEQGDELEEGDLIVEVVGRPVFLLVGEIPMYRDLRPGSSGDDVLQLEQALSRLGFLEGSPDETWDDETGVAVANWYATTGYRPNGLSEEDETALSAARDRVRSAEAALADSRTTLEQAAQGPGQSAILSAEGEVTAAQDALELAEMEQEWAIDDADEAVETAQTQLATAEHALDIGMNADPPISEEELAQLQQTVAEAQMDLGTAQRERERIAAEQDALVTQAATRLEVAKASLIELKQAPDTSSMRRQVEVAQEELSAAREDFANLEGELGTWVPAGELVFLDRLPVRVDQVSVARGSEISGAFATVTGSAVTIRSAVSEADAVLLEEGMSVQIENPEDGSLIPGAIVSVADRTGTNGVAPDRVYVEIQPEELPDEIIGQNVRVVIPVSTTGGEVLAVPAAALYATADGSTRVEVEDEDESLRSVRVETGLAAGGLVEITPLDGDVSEGDLVVVGRADGSAPGGNAVDEDVETTGG